MNTLRSWWHGLADRERVLVGVGATILLGCLYFLLVLDPLDQRVERLEKSLRAELATRAWLESQRSVALATTQVAPASANDGRSVLAVINDAASAHGVATGLKRVTPVNEKSYILGFEEVSYQGLMQSLVEMVEQRGATVERIRMERRDLAGIVSAEASLQFP